MDKKNKKKGARSRPDINTDFPKRRRKAVPRDRREGRFLPWVRTSSNRPYKIRSIKTVNYKWPSLSCSSSTELRTALTQGNSPPDWVHVRESLVSSVTITEIEPQVTAMTRRDGTIPVMNVGTLAGRHLSVSPHLHIRIWDLLDLLSTLLFDKITNRPDNGLKGCETWFQRNWRYGYIISDMRGTNLQVLMIIPRLTPLWVFRVLPTEVLCDSILVIFNEWSNEPYITNISEAEYLWRMQRIPPVSGNHYVR